MKKKLLIHTIDGKIIERDLESEAKNLPIGTPANDQHYAGLCQFIAINGLPVDGSKTSLEYLPPSQIKKVVVSFETSFLK